MGLRLGDQKRLLVPLTLALTAVIFVFFDDLGHAGFRLDRAAIADGEWLRLVSGHFVHLSYAHFGLNIAGLVLVWALVGNALSGWQWLLVVLLSIASISAGLLLWLPALDWYVGLSGLLHGLLVAGLVASWQQRRPELRLLAAILLLKLAWEALVGPMPGSGGIAGGPVVTESHLFGALGGLVAGLLLRGYNAPPSQDRNQL